MLSWSEQNIAKVAFVRTVLISNLEGVKAVFHTLKFGGRNISQILESY